MSSPPDGLLLHTAAVTGNLEATRQLIEAGSDVNLCDSVGLTPLHLAAWRGYPEVCLVLLQKKADPLVVDKQGGSPLHFAAQCGHADVIQILLASGADVRASSTTGATALHLAAECGSAACVSHLLTGGANPNVTITYSEERSRISYKAIDLAAESNHLACVRILLHHSSEVGASGTRKRKQTTQSKADEFVETALQRAVEMDQMDHDSKNYANRLEDPGRYAKHAKFFTAKHAQELLEKGMVVVDSALSVEGIRSLHNELVQLHRGGQMQQTLQSLTNVRQDKVLWLSEEETEGPKAPREGPNIAHREGLEGHKSPSELKLPVLCPSISRAICLLKGLAAQLNSTLDTKLVVPLKVMATCYPADGAYYRVHRDNVQHSECRLCSSAMKPSTAPMKDLTMDQKDPMKDRIHPTKDQKDPTKDQKVPTKDRKDPTKDRKDLTKDQKDPTKDQKDPTKDRKDPTKDQKDAPMDRTELAPLRRMPWRQVTAVLYANLDDWDDARDGGCLRCYTDAHPEDDAGDTSERVQDVSPKGGRLVLFWSGHMLHEVLPSYRERYALTLWIMGS